MDTGRNGREHTWFFPSPRRVSGNEQPGGFGAVNFAIVYLAAGTYHSTYLQSTVGDASSPHQTKK
jgi:hypothetical protein